MSEFDLDVRTDRPPAAATSRITSKSLCTPGLHHRPAALQHRSVQRRLLDSGLALNLSGIRRICSAASAKSAAAEIAAARAALLSGHGQHLLLCGDPVAPAEMVAAPSASRAGGIAVCLLDADTDAQADLGSAANV